MNTTTIQDALKIAGSAHAVISEALKLTTGRTGGYFCLADNFGQPILILAVGEVDDAEKRARYLKNAQEKACRVAETLTVLASETQDPDNGKYAGAVKGRRFIFAFSGLPQEIDETAMIALAAYTL